MVIYVTGLGQDFAQSGAGGDPQLRGPHAGVRLAEGDAERDGAGSDADQVCRRDTADRPGSTRSISSCRRAPETTRRSGSRRGIWRRQPGLNCRCGEGIAATFRA